MMSGLSQVAGLMTTISMAVNGGDQEGQWRLRALKGWMTKKGLPKNFQIPLTEYCHELWTNRYASQALPLSAFRLI